MAGMRGEARAQGLARLRDLVIRRETAREGLARAARLAHDAAVDAGLHVQYRRPPPRLSYPRWGWRRAIEHAVDQRMFSRDHLAGYRRLLGHRARSLARGEHVTFQGLALTGRDVQLRAAPGNGRIVVGPWCWLGDGNRLRCHEGQLVIGAKVVFGSDNVVNTWLDVLVDDASILADWIYVCDFDHRFERLDVPIKDQGIATAPVRIGAGTWVGTKATILRGVDIGVGSVIGAHAVVTADLPPWSIAVGTPARRVRSRLPEGMDPEEAAALHVRGLPIPGDPLEG